MSTSLPAIVTYCGETSPDSVGEILPYCQMLAGLWCYRVPGQTWYYYF